MAARSKPDKTSADSRNGTTQKGKARLEIDADGKGLAVHVDRQGFRRLLQTLERLAATEEPQTFEKSGRSRRRANSETGEQAELMERIVFHITDRS
ncbi:MAG: hypothetical protein ACR2RA_26400 [Geminicoccaceae bacterium]